MYFSHYLLKGEWVSSSASLGNSTDQLLADPWEENWSFFEEDNFEK